MNKRTADKPNILGPVKCAAEILMQASKRIGRPINLGNERSRTTMDMQDAIADVSVNNPEGAVEAFKALHDYTGASDLIRWQNGKTDAELAVAMREAAKRCTQ